MNKERKTNIIRALKDEVRFLKHQPIKIIREVPELNHLRLCASIRAEEVASVPKDLEMDLLKHNLVKAFSDNITQMPIETEFDERFGAYRATLDIWVKDRW